MFKRPTTRARRRQFYFTDQGTMCPCDETEEDAGRQRLARLPESNHYSGGEFRDDVSDPEDYLRPEDADPRNQNRLRPRAPGEYAGSTTMPGHRGMREGAPRATISNPGQLGTGAVEAPWTNNAQGGLIGSAEYDARTNTTTTGRDPTLLGNTSARGMASMRPDGMPKATAADQLRRINQANRRFWQRDDADPPETEEEDEPAVTRWEQTQPDGSRIVHTREVHSAPMQHTSTVDPLNPRRPPVLSGSRDSAGSQQGRLRAQRVRQGVDAVAAMNAANRKAWNNKGD